MNYKFPSIKDWLKALDKDLDIPLLYLSKARVLRDGLLKTSSDEVLLHGDLHHDNILQNGNDWVVIDPKGIVGESCYEVAAFIRNPIAELLDSANAPSILKARIAEFARMTNLAEKRIRDWCFVQAVLSWSWALEDDGNPSYFIRFLEALH
jgi:streptomycin 6-kinase